ncbi:unnamed protein product [Paramecium sonneborni]|uniref:RING-type domain-containing protein n=1 Tax=Paramecium sonneborni TaxID=65129 RepID=A0A8S1NCX5_9CILI|nr:unnamed protein product [Paramecium sonneborni]
MKNGQVGPISEQLKSKYKEFQHYSFMQCLGSNFELTLLISILDCLLFNNNEQLIQKLVNPNQPYSKSSQIIANKIYNYILKERNLSQFYEQIYIDDPQFIKTKEFLHEYCNIYQISIDYNSQNQLNKLSDHFLISFQFFGEIDMKISNKKQFIFIYKEKNQYYYIKQYFDNRNKQIQLKTCSKCKKLKQINFINQKSKNYICNKCNLQNNQQISQQNSSTNINRLRENQFQQQKNKQITNTDILIKKRKVENDIEQQQYQDNSNQKLLICMKCKDKSQTQIFTNKQCNHTFCLKCLNQLINDLDVNYSCLEVNCEQPIDSLSYFNFYEKFQNNDGQIQKQEFQTEYIKCDGCSKRELINLSFTNLCFHTFCRDCSIKFAKHTSTNLSCPYLQCYQKISYEQLIQFFKIEKILFQCSKCINKLDRENLYLNFNCSHFLCFNCSYELVMKNNQNNLDHSCPVNNCYNLLDSSQFNKFFEQNQKIALQEQEKKEQLQDQILKQNKESQSNKQLQEKVTNITQKENIQQDLQILNQNNNDEQKLEIFDNEEENNEYTSQGECTLCKINFSAYNLRQKLQCKSHQIGVCCSLDNVNCPQCYRPKNSIKSKLNLLKIKQDFDFYNFKNSSLMCDRVLEYDQ